MPKGRDGAIVVDDGDDDELDLDDVDDDDDEGEEDEEDEEPPSVEEQRQRRRADKTDKPTTDKPADKPSYEDLVKSNARLEEAVRRNNQENAKNRQRLKALEESGIDTSAATGVPDQKEIDRLVALEVEKRLAADAEERAGLADRSSKLETSLRQKALEAALKGAGFNGTFATALKVVDLDKIALADGDGGYEVTGTDEVVEGLKKEIPAWFGPPRRPGIPPRRGAEEVDGGSRPGRPAPKQTWEQQIVNNLTGRK